MCGCDKCKVEKGEKRAKNDAKTMLVRLMGYCFLATGIAYQTANQLSIESNLFSIVVSAGITVIGAVCLSIPNGMMERFMAKKEEHEPLLENAGTEVDAHVGHQD